MKRVALISAVALLSAVSQAQSIQFFNYVFSGGPLSPVTPSVASGAFANAITFNTPNAIVGDPAAIRTGSLSIQYDAASSAPLFANQVNVSIQGGILGTGTITFREDVFEIDALGNEIRLLGSISRTWSAVNGQGPTINWTGTINFTATATRIRAKKDFTLNAPDSSAFDLAAVTLVNQAPQVVPEPATMTALGLGAAALLRRRKNKAS